MGGAMRESRGRKGKKTKWQLQVGLKELIFTGLGVAGLAMMSFALGTLAGRGDIYRLLHNWGLLGPDSGQAVKIWHQPTSPSSTPVAALSNSPPQEAPAPASAKTGPPQVTAAPQPPPSPPMKGDIAAPPSPLQDKKKSPKTEDKAKDEKLENIRREVAGKLKFQNSMDLAATRGSKPGGESKKGSDKELTGATRGSTSQVFVVKFRDAEKAQTRLAEMRKQGDKVALKEGKDEEGRFFAIYRQVTANPSKPSQVAPTQVKKSKPENKPEKSTVQSH